MECVRGILRSKLKSKMSVVKKDRVLRRSVKPEMSDIMGNEWCRGAPCSLLAAQAIRKSHKSHKNKPLFTFTRMSIEVIETKLALIRMTLSEIASELKQLKKKQHTDLSTHPKQRKGIHKPVDVHPAVLQFMGLPAGEKVARTEFNSFLARYVKEHQLTKQVELPKKHQVIIPDSVMIGLMDKTKQVPNELTYFNMQGLFNHLFRSHF